MARGIDSDPLLGLEGLLFDLKPFELGLWKISFDPPKVVGKIEGRNVLRRGSGLVLVQDSGVFHAEESADPDRQGTNKDSNV